MKIPTGKYFPKISYYHISCYFEKHLVPSVESKREDMAQKHDLGRHKSDTVDQK